MVPAGLITLSLIRAGWLEFKSGAKPLNNEDTSLMLSSLLSPCFTPPSIMASATRAKNAGPLPAIAVATSSSFSLSTQKASPTVPNISMHSFWIFLSPVRVVVEALSFALTLGIALTM